VPQGPPPTHRQVSRAGDIQIELFSTFHAAAEHFTRVIFFILVEDTLLILVALSNLNLVSFDFEDWELLLPAFFQALISKTQIALFLHL
jgi:hypothetical protein